VLHNLLANAIGYTHHGRLLLGCRRFGAEVRIEVWDTGIGIPREKLEAVFEDFFQLGNPERQRAKGFGLGLAIVRRTALLLNHRLQVRSWPDQGSVFAIVVPRAGA
jgi:signal transduction histidine kinase